MNPVLTEAPPYPFTALDAKKDALRAKGVTLHDFTIGDPLEPTPRFIKEAMIAAIPDVSQYPTVAGRKSFREAVSAYFKRRFRIDVDPETEIIPCSGAKEAVFHLAMAIVDRASEKRTVVYGEPAYPVYERGAAYAGGEPYAVPLTRDNRFYLEPANVPADVLARTCLMWLNYPHNPTGAVCGTSLYGRVAAASREHGFVVASDETYADLYGSEALPSYLNVTKENALVIHSLSKRSGMTGYRSGFIAGDAKLIALLKKMRPSVGVASPVFVQAAAEAAWSEDAHVAERRAIFADKRARVMSLCRELGLDALESAAGLYVWIAVPQGATSLSYSENLLAGGVVVTPGESFGPSGAGFIRVALVPLVKDFDAALGAWRKAHAS